MREFLKGLDLDKETIDSIMAEHGKHLTGLKEQVESFKTEVQGYKTTIDKLKQKIENLHLKLLCMKKDWITLIQFLIKHQ